MKRAQEDQVPPVPHTYFLQEAALLIQQNILARLDPALDGQPYFHLDYGSRPPEARHASWDYCDMAGRFVDALILIRQMTGNQDGLEAEQQLRRFLLARSNPHDGLFYDAAAPWSRYAADMFCQGRVLHGLVSWLMLTREPEVEATLERFVHGLSRIADHHDDYCSYPHDLWIEDRWVEGGLWEGKAPGYSAQQINGLARYAAASESSAALELAGKLSRFFVYHSGAVNPDGSYRGHTHSGGILPTTSGVLRYALLVNDTALIAWSKRVYEFTRSQSSTFGWVPDGVGFDPHTYPFAGTCETCSLVDMIELALLLSDAGIGDYWDDVERFTRNQFLENQIHDVDQVVAPEVRQHSHTPVESILYGSFESTARPNSLLAGPEPLLEGCCTGAAGRGCFLAWERTIVERPDGIFINLLFSRDSPWVDLVTYEPYRGHISLRIHQQRPFSIRIPGWVEPEAVRLHVNGIERTPVWQGKYLALGVATPGEVWNIDYPLLQRHGDEHIAGESYRLRWRGGTVTGIEPNGIRYPIFNREAFETSDPPGAPRTFMSTSVRVGR